MTAKDLADIAYSMPYDAEVRFVCKPDDNPHNDYYDVYHAYLLQYQGDDEGCVLYLTGSST